ncbi:MAG TPA: PUR family DNA/RNA-binding protein [Thermodesulfobacteriota bacterium]|nr:PUR family DNA/RNA-binding protein [Thermodesulfobacteriota bacterium]
MSNNTKSRLLASDKLHIENKTLFVDLRENDRGRFLQIAELSNDRKSTVVIPISGLALFMESLQKISDGAE